MSVPSAVTWEPLHSHTHGQRGWVTRCGPSLQLVVGTTSCQDEECWELAHNHIMNPLIHIQYLIAFNTRPNTTTLLWLRNITKRGNSSHREGEEWPWFPSKNLLAVFLDMCRGNQKGNPSQESGLFSCFWIVYAKLSVFALNYVTVNHWSAPSSVQEQILHASFDSSVHFV